MSMSIEDLERDLDDATEMGDIEAIEAATEALDRLMGGRPETNDDGETDVGDPEGEQPDGEPGASSSAADEESSDEPEKPEGIATKNGKGVIPYEELEKARQEAAQLRQELDDLRTNPETDPAIVNELERLRRLTATYESQITESGQKPRPLPEEFRVDPEKLRELEEYGEVGSVVAMLAQQNALLLERIENQKPRTREDDPKPVAPAEEIVAADPDLSRWIKSELAWTEVQKVDEYVLTLPEYAGKSLSERKEKVVELVKQRLGEAPPPQTAPEKPRKSAEEIIEGAQRTPTSLSEIGGQAGIAESSFEERTAGKSDIDIAIELERELARGRKIDDLL